MKNIYKVKKKYNLFGSQCGMFITMRLRHINGKVMLYLFYINIVYIILDKLNIPVEQLISIKEMTLWNIIGEILGLAFWVVFLDGIVVRYLQTYTRGHYFEPFIVKVCWSGWDFAKHEFAEALSWGYAFETHPEFEYKNLEIKNKYFAVGDKEGGEEAMRKLFKEYGFYQDKKGRYHFNWEGLEKNK